METDVSRLALIPIMIELMFTIMILSSDDESCLKGVFAIAILPIWILIAVCNMELSMWFLGFPIGLGFYILFGGIDA
jgi:hypothetical protein